MRYILDSDGYLKFVSFGSEIRCGTETCVEYTGEVPGFVDSLEQWYLAASENNILCQYKIVDGNLVRDTEKETPKEKGPAVDYVVEQGEKAGWIYRIWSNGDMEMWINSTWKDFDLSSLALYSNFYCRTFWLGFPIAFAAPPAVVIDGGSLDFVHFLRLAKSYPDKMSVWFMSLVEWSDPIDLNYHVYARGKAITDTTAVLGTNKLGVMKLGEGAWTTL